jgi:hypothetical protein
LVRQDEVDSTKSSYTTFNRATFTSDAWFTSTTFGTADFISAKFFGNAHFPFSVFSDGADFTSATFLGDLTFINAEFDATTIFVNTTFAASVPDFRGATMHEATEWHGSIWPKPPHGMKDAQAQVYAYERLKLEMERLKKHEDEQRFFRKELRARRALESPLSVAWYLNFVYGALSDYGQSVVRPILGIVACFAIGCFVFAFAPVFNGTHLIGERAAALSFANIFSFLPIKREIMTPAMIEGLSDLAQIIGAVQSLVGAILLFLLGLALRNRFRMK